MSCDLSDKTLIPLSDLLDATEFPLLDFIPESVRESVFEELFYTQADTYFEGDDTIIDLELVVSQALSVSPLGDDLFTLYFARAVEEASCFQLRVVIGEEPELVVFDASLTLEFSERILRNEEDGGRVGFTVSGDFLFSPDGIFINNTSEEVFTLSKTLIVPLDLTIESVSLFVDFSGDEKCVALKWAGGSVNEIFSSIIPSINEASEPVQQEYFLQFVIGDPIEEVRFDWIVHSSGQTIDLPGVQVEIPNDSLFSLVVGAGTEPLGKVSLFVTVTDSAVLKAKSNFAWEREDQRELHNDESRSDQEDALFELSLLKKEDVAVSYGTTILLASFDLADLKRPVFLRQLVDPITFPDIDRRSTLCQPVDTESVPLGLDQWDLSFDINLGEDFTFPFLKQDESNSDSGIGQYLSIKGPELNDLKPDLETSGIQIPFIVELRFGDLVMTTELAAIFNWESFALSFDHTDGLALVSEKPALPEQPVNFIGLDWQFKGAEITEGDNAGKYSYFTVVTDRYNYQVKQAVGAKLDLAFGGISSEPLRFEVSDFAITPKGLNLRSTVIDAPIRLNGLDTKFRFDGSGIVIENSEIQSFTIAGSGALPPALVGDSRASIALQFDRTSAGNLTLRSGEARLEGNNLLHCKGTRFQFSIDALGLKFVNDGKFHLYFTLTGSAQFVLAEGDSADGPLALLPKVKIDLVEAPLTGDVSVIGKHVKFLVELPKPVSFNFLGCFEMELRGIGFEPQAEVFDGDGAMLISGQLKFAQGAGDVVNSRIDFHNLHIGLPKRGSFIPRIYFKQLGVMLNVGDAFKLSGVVDFIDEDQEVGFTGEGLVEIKGLPTLAGSFGFLRVRQNENSPWLRAWFIYLELRKVSFPIPIVQIYLREVGLGFGYRYTLASIKAADQEGDIGKLLNELRTLSRTQGDLSKRDRWAVDLEKPNEDPRWTVALRAMLSQTSAAPSPLKYNENSEKDLSCIYLFDAVIALRSDLTFFMSVRGWFNTNYNDFVTNNQGLRNKPLLTGFVLLSPRQKRFLAQVASNPDGKIGPHPPLPNFVKSAIESAEFTATLLIEPGLLHYEMGWPNMLRWSGRLGPIDVEFRGGFIFRFSKSEFVTGQSFTARGTIDVEAGFSAGVFGVSVGLFAHIAYGARYIGVLAFKNPGENSAFYGAIGLELYVRIRIEFWIKFAFFKKRWRFSVGVGFTAALEVGILGNAPPGIRGRGTISLRAMGRNVRFGVDVGINKDAVEDARSRTDKFLNIGFEATEVDALPGLSPDEPEGFSASFATTTAPPALSRSRSLSTGEASVNEVLQTPEYSIFAIRESGDLTYFVLIPAGERKAASGQFEVEPGFLPPPPEKRIDPTPAGVTVANLQQAANGDAAAMDALRTALGISGAIQVRNTARDEESGEVYEWSIREVDPSDDLVGGVWFRVELENGAPGTFQVHDQGGAEADGIVQHDFRLILPAAGLPAGTQLERFDPLENDWVDATAAGQDTWKVNWRAVVLEEGEDLSNAETNEQNVPEGASQGNISVHVADYIRSAFVECPGGHLVDPDLDDEEDNAVEDNRVQNPTDDAFESAVKGAFEQFRGSPFFKHDPKNRAYDRSLNDAFDTQTSIYDGDKTGTPVQREHADQMRGLIVHDLIADLQEFTALPADEREAAEPTDETQDLINQALAFQMGLIFRVKGERPAWLDSVDAPDSDLPQLQQRESPEATEAQSDATAVRSFNVPLTSFNVNPPRFDRIRHYTSSSTVAMTWDLNWDTPPVQTNSKCQVDPEHHLLHYEVRRRSLDSNDRDVIFTVKSGDILNQKEKAGLSVLERLRPRFQFVDNFDDLTEAERVRIPEQGVSYLYSITPIDFAQQRGRPITIVATRFPDEPPLVPVNGELTVTYRINREDALAQEVSGIPSLIDQEKTSVNVQWSEPRVVSDRPEVPIREYQLVFRRELTLPIGSYGLDSSTQREKVKALPTSNARTRKTDIIVPLGKENIAFIESIDAGLEDTRHNRVGSIPLGDLRKAGVIEDADAASWQPEAWRIFFRTVSDGGVPSALAPVHLKLRVEAENAEVEGFVSFPEERRPAELEWLPTPIRLPLLPPEDLKATSGTAHFPMPFIEGTVLTPENAAQAIFGDDVSGNLLQNIRFQDHPQQIRSIRFRWNQGPSTDQAYPLQLTAGYEVLQLDIDAHRDETLSDEQKLANVLSMIQQVQMLPADDLILTPNDTLTTNQWEAWYTSSLLRRNIRDASQEGADAVEGSESPLSPWFSWRESVLVWPDWPDLEKGRETSLHPFLDQIIETLQELYIVDLQISPPIQPTDFIGLLRATAPGSDPYGWSVLQRFGLSVTFSLRNADTGELLVQDELLTAVQSAIESGSSSDLVDDWKKHLHVELLFQANQSISLKPEEVAGEALLGIMQLSMRPQPAQYLRYFAIDLQGIPGSEIEMVLVDVPVPLTMIIQAEEVGFPIEIDPLEPTEDENGQIVPPDPITKRIRMPLNGATRVLIRSDHELDWGMTWTDTAAEEQVRFHFRSQTTSLVDQGDLDQDARLSSVDINGTAYIQFGNAVAAEEFETLYKDLESTEIDDGKPLSGEDVARLNAIAVGSVVEFSPASEPSAYFPVPVERAILSIDADLKSQVAQQWRRFKAYAESLNSAGRESVSPPDELRISVPEAEDDLRQDNLFAQFLGWAQRFFDHSAAVFSTADPVPGNQDVYTGPWIATAYPRASTPAFSTPDDLGRLEYFHLLEDRWAHNYRYYIRPFSRYEQLWRSMYLSPLLWPDDAALDETAIKPAVPDLDVGGLDVVLDRTKEVDMPTILRSGRLDVAGLPSQPVSPGSVWEVIIAQHREQALSERNQTLYRQLSFRQVAYSLLRKFAFSAQWDGWRRSFDGFDTSFTYPNNEDALLPETINPRFFDLDDTASLSPEDEVRFALPLRLSRFQQGAIAVQWEALPFYYEHRMLAIAQTASQVSPVNSIVQKDFEYQAPEPALELEPDLFCAPFLEGNNQFGARYVEFPVRRLWDSIPGRIQARWPDEDPDAALDLDMRLPGLMPDHEVVYQIIDFVQGNIEVQAEIFFNPVVEEDEIIEVHYAARQLGQAQIVQEVVLLEDAERAGFRIRVLLEQSNTDDIDWSIQEAITDPDGIDVPPDLGILPQQQCLLVLEGPLTASQVAAIEQLPGDEAFQSALSRMVVDIDNASPGSCLAGPVARERIPLGPEQPRPTLPEGWTYADFLLEGLPGDAKIQLNVEDATSDEPSRITSLVWQGPLFSIGLEQLLLDLNQWAQIQELQDAVNEVLTSIQQRTVFEEYDPVQEGSITPEDIPISLQEQLVLIPDQFRMEFRGLLQHVEQLADLETLAETDGFSESSREALRSIIRQLSEESTEVDVAIQLRPTSQDLSESLAGKLLVGHTLVQFEGVMSLEKAQELMELPFILEADRLAFRRLYRRSVLLGLEGRSLRLRTLRGSAEPSEMREMEAKPLE